MNINRSSLFWGVLLIGGGILALPISLVTLNTFPLRYGSSSLLRSAC